MKGKGMDYVKVVLDMNWFWLGPWLFISLGIGVVALFVDMFRD